MRISLVLLATLLMGCSEPEPEAKPVQLSPEFQAKVNAAVQKQTEAQAVAAMRAGIKSRLAARPQYASELEESLLSRGMDAHVRAVGTNKDRLVITWAGMSRPIVYNMINAPAMSEQVPGLGFKTVVMTDGYAESWTYNWVAGNWKQ